MNDVHVKQRRYLWWNSQKSLVWMFQYIYNHEKYIFKTEYHSENYSPPQSPYQVFYVKLPKYFSGLRVFGEIGILKTYYSRLQSKLQNKGSTEIFVGYSTRNFPNIYIMFNLTTQSISISREISWINVNYGKWNSRVKKSTTHQITKNNSSTTTMITTVFTNISTLS